MARIDDYESAKAIAVDALAGESLDAILERTKFEPAGDTAIRVAFLDRVYRVSLPDFAFTDAGDESRSVPLQEQVLILHYMMAHPGAQVSGNWIAYREIPGASFYFSAFVKRAIDPLKKVFGQNISALNTAAQHLGGRQIGYGDAGLEFSLLPEVPVQLILWQGDDEFPSEANILFDESIGDILSPEDAAWLAGMLVYRLIARSH